MVTSSDGSTFTVNNYQWNTTGCYTNPAHSSGNPTCFPTGKTTQSVTETDLTAEDAGTITCTATIGGIDYTSESFTLRISGKTQHHNINDNYIVLGRYAINLVKYHTFNGRYT